MSKKIQPSGSEFMWLSIPEPVEADILESALGLPYKEGKHKTLSRFLASLIFLYNVNYLTSQLEGKDLDEITILGADLSINAPGIIILDYDGDIVFEHTITSKPKDKKGVIMKLESIYLELNKIFGIYRPDIIVQEDVNARGSFQAMKKISYVASVLRLVVSGNYDMENQPPIFLYPSTKLKKCFTGSGRAEKIDILNSHRNDSGVDFGKDDNKADAYSCARIGKAILDVLRKFKEYKIELEESNIFLPNDLNKFDLKSFKLVWSFIENSSSCCSTIEEYELAIFDLIDKELISEVNGEAYHDLQSKIKKIKPV